MGEEAEEEEEEERERKEEEEKAEAERKKAEEEAKKAKEVELALNELRESVAAFRDVASSGEQGMPLRMAKMRVAQATKAAAAAGIDQEIIVEASKPPEPPPEPEKPKEEAPEPETSADGKKMVRETNDDDEK